MAIKQGGKDVGVCGVVSENRSGNDAEPDLTSHLCRVIADEFVERERHHNARSWTSSCPSGGRATPVMAAVGPSGHAAYEFVDGVVFSLGSGAGVCRVKVTASVALEDLFGACSDGVLDCLLGDAIAFNLRYVEPGILRREGLGSAEHPLAVMLSLGAVGGGPLR